MTEAAPKKTRVAVLGGGTGAMAAAFELLRTPERRAALDVTVYQMGWRLGGKGASGRNHARGERIEEHGLHLWFGFYDNAFRVLGDAYDVAARPKGKPLATLWDAFEKCHEVVIYDEYDKAWASEVFDIPTDDARPGTGGDPPPLPGEVVHATVEHLHERWRSLVGVRGFAVELAEHAFAEALSHAEKRHAGNQHIHHELDELIADALKVARAVVWHHVRHDLDHAPSRHLFQIVDIVTSGFCGIVTDRVFEKGFSSIDDLDLLAWLKHHGASDLTVGHGGNSGSGLLRGFYDLVFAFADGDPAKPDLAAGRALQAALKMGFDFKGSILWRMCAGMGDTVFGPFYEALTKLAGPESVRFFHRVTGLRLDPSGTSIAAIDLVQQAAPVAAGYHPMRNVKDLPCWPNRPYWDELQGGEALKAHDLEAPCPVPGEVPLTLEVGRDFDLVVLAIPAPAHPEICAELITANTAYATMVDSCRAVATQAFQVWSTESEPALGWAFPQRGVASGFVEPLDTLCPMPQLLDREDWPDGSVQSIWYACGVLPDAAKWSCDHPDQRPRVRHNTLDWLEQRSSIPWPAASSGGKFEWNVLSDPGGTSTGPARFGSQYWRANVTPSELYVRTPPKSVTKRLWPGQSGFTNLALAGDWTRNYIDGGCVEAAVMSGLLAARYVLEQAKVADDHVRIDGEGTWLLEDDG